MIDNNTPEQKLVKKHCGHDTCKGAGTYRIKCKCVNCGWVGTLELTKGHEFSRLSHDCPGCGCNQLMRAS